MAEKICPFMSRPDSDYLQCSFISCQKEKCMAWGKVGIIRTKEGEWNGYEFGCKRIERGGYEG